MLTVAIIGLLAAIAIPKFADMVLSAKEAAVRGKLGGLRSAISIHYADNESFYPVIAPSSFAKYMDPLPKISIPTFPPHRSGYASRYGVFDSDFT